MDKEATTTTTNDQKVTLETWKPKHGVAFIFNPHANKGESKIFFEKQKERLTSIYEPVPTHILETQKPGGGYDRALEAVTHLHCDLVVACGGDGTINEVLNGILDPKTKTPRATMAIMGLGTGNDFRRTLGFPDNDLDAYVKALEEGYCKQLDYGEVQSTHIEEVEPDQDETEGEKGEEEENEESNEEVKQKTNKRAIQKRRFFMNECTYGLGGAVMQAINKQKNHPFGKTASFVFHTLYQQFAYENKPAVMHFDDTDPVQMVQKMTSVCNGRYFGNSMMVAPRARPDSGSFQVCCVGDVTVIQSIPIIKNYYHGTHIHHQKVHTMECKRFRASPLHSNDHIFVEIDGELFGQLPCDIVKHHQKLTMIVPKDFEDHQPQPLYHDDK